MKHVTQLASDLVAIASVNPMGGASTGPGMLEADVTRFLEAHFGSLGMPLLIQPVSPGRANVVAWLTGTPGAGTVLFEAHQDTVPAGTMAIEPFTPRIENGRLYGRGACDVKGAMAAMLTAVGRVARESPEPRAGVVIACTVDEEHEFTGVLEFIRATLGPASPPWPRPSWAVVAEPTELAVVAAHKGAVRWKIETEGRACHSSNPTLGTNAIYRMARVVQALECYADRLRTTSSDPLVGPPTLSVGCIQGGVSVNTVPDRCVIEIDRRLIPGEDPVEACREVARFLENRPELDFPVRSLEPWLKSPPLDCHENGELSRRLAAVIEQSGRPARVIGVPFGTDASKLAVAGIPSVVFGPGSIAEAHTANEWIEIDQLVAAADIYFRLIVSGLVP